MQCEKEAGTTWLFWRRRRYVVALWAFCGFFMSYVLRVNLSIAIVNMTANRTIANDNGTVSYVSVIVLSDLLLTK